ncbi:MAG: leucine-rich repeat protein [Kiritimatiellae bacterium]|nr:leucine-rich repeat protein [Kiritimatiellia bacterium]
MSLLETGSHFGDFTVDRLLGKTKVGEFYVVISAGSEVKHIVEIVHPAMNGGESELRQAFDRELDYAQQLEGREVTKVLDFGLDPQSGYYYVVMTYKDGSNLPALLGIKLLETIARDSDRSWGSAIIALLMLVALGGAGVAVWWFMRGNKPAPEVESAEPSPVQEQIAEAPAQPAAEAPAAPKVLNDKTVRKTRIGAYMWHYTIADGMAVLWRGSDAYVGAPCMEPMPAGRIVVPAEIDGYRVGALGALAFFNCKNVTAVVLPDTVKRIGNRCFLGCTQLAEINFPDAVERIGIWAFNRCESLTRLDLNRCAYLDYEGGVFAFCRSLKEYAVSPENSSFKVEDGVLYSRDGKKLFAVPPAKADFKIPKDVEEIGAYALCNSCLSRLVVPESVRVLGEGVFAECAKMEAVAIAGDAPKLLGNKGVFFRGTSGKLEVVVKEGSTGWTAPGVAELPDKWPDGRGRTIRHKRASDPNADRSGKKKRRK